MISKLNDDAALDLLMTSDFDDNLSPKELKDMLLKYRYFYRILHGRMERSTGDIQFEAQKLSELVDTQNGYIAQLQSKCAKMEDEIILLKSRKLSLKERLLGKIINKDEDKRL